MVDEDIFSSKEYQVTYLKWWGKQEIVLVQFFVLFSVTFRGNMGSIAGFPSAHILPAGFLFDNSSHDGLFQSS